jgi:CAAX protease family protein
VAAWGVGRWIGIDPLQHLDFAIGAVALGVLATLPMLLGLWWTLTTSWRPLRNLVDLVVGQLGPALERRSAFQLALLALLAGVGEEVLFRGVLQAGLAREFSNGWALALASATFGLAHFASPAYAVLAGMVGLYLGGWFLLQGNLLVPIVAHSLYDFVALAYLVRRYRGAGLDSSHGRYQRNQ